MKNPTRYSQITGLINVFEGKLLWRIFIGFSSFFAFNFATSLVLMIAFDVREPLFFLALSLRLVGLGLNLGLFLYALFHRSCFAWLRSAGVLLTISNFILSLITVWMTVKNISISALNSIPLVIYILILGLFMNNVWVSIFFSALLMAIHLIPHVFFSHIFFDSSLPVVSDSLMIVIISIILAILLIVIVIIQIVQALVYKNLKSQENYFKGLAFRDQDTGLPNFRELQRKLAGNLELLDSEKNFFVLAGFRILKLEELGERLGYDTAAAWVDRFAEALELAVMEMIQEKDLFLTEQPSVVYRLETGIFAFSCVIDSHEQEASDFLSQEFTRLISDILSKLHSDALVSFYGTFTIWPLDSNNANDLIRNLLNTLHRIFHPDKSCFQPFNAEALEKFFRLEQLEGQMISDSFTNEIFAVFQPKVSAQTGLCEGFEALARWTNPILGSVSPSEFIGIAEQVRQIDQVTARILEDTASFIEQIKKISLEPVRIAINLSPKLMTRKNILDLREWIIKKDVGMWLEIEITEGVLVNMDQLLEEDFRLLRETGVTFAIDDFGTGYSNLSYLQRFEAEVMKVDKSFIDGLPHDETNAKLVSAILQMATAFGMKSVAEGVETEEQLSFLTAAGCDLIQGYYFSRPLSPSNAISWLLERN